MTAPQLPAPPPIPVPRSPSAHNEARTGLSGPRAPKAKAFGRPQAAVQRVVQCDLVRCGQTTVCGARAPFRKSLVPAGRLSVRQTDRRLVPHGRKTTVPRVRQDGPQPGQNPVWHGRRKGLLVEALHPGRREANPHGASPLAIVRPSTGPHRAARLPHRPRTLPLPVLRACTLKPWNRSGPARVLPSPAAQVQIG